MLYVHVHGSYILVREWLTVAQFYLLLFIFAKTFFDYMQYIFDSSPDSQERSMAKVRLLTMHF